MERRTGDGRLFDLRSHLKYLKTGPYLVVFDSRSLFFPSNIQPSTLSHITLSHRKATGERKRLEEVKNNSWKVQQIILHQLVTAELTFAETLFFFGRRGGTSSPKCSYSTFFFSQHQLLLQNHSSLITGKLRSL